MTRDTHDRAEAEALRARLAEAEDTLRAIRRGEIDALVVEGAGGNQVYTLHSAEEPYRNFVEQMQEGAVTLTGRGDILYANACFATLVGEPLESVVGSRIGRFVNPPDLDGFEALLAAGAGRQRSRLSRPSIGAFEVSVSLTTMSAANGRRLNLTVMDVSELLAAERHRDVAVRENRTKDEFLAMLGHELRTPLSAISHANRVLEAKQHDVESTTRPRVVIGRQVRHITRLIDDLLDVERVVTGKLRLRRQPLDMTLMVRRVVAMFDEDAPRLHIDVTTEPLWVDADAVRLEQVVTNIVNNAIKYTPAGGRIWVDLRADGRDVLLTVEDTGFGISPRMLPFVFDMYVQADRTLDNARGGLGIGLTLVRHLVELHGGTIVASSNGEGQGSCFTVRLARIPGAHTSSTTSPPPERRARPRRVLLIEDGADAREMLRMTLELAGHEVYDAPDGVRGLALVDVARPDAAIIDIGLPGMDGYEVATRIREAPHGRGMLLLALTGYDALGGAERASRHGFDYHLIKPVDLDYLARLLNEGAEPPPRLTSSAPS